VSSEEARGVRQWHIDNQRYLKRREDYRPANWSSFSKSKLSKVCETAEWTVGGGTWWSEVKIGGFSNIKEFPTSHCLHFAGNSEVYGFDSSLLASQGHIPTFKDMKRRVSRAQSPDLWPFLNGIQIGIKQFDIQRSAVLLSFVAHANIPWGVRIDPLKSAMTSNASGPG